MSRFHYTARGPHGPVQGVQEAASAAAVADELRMKGWVPLTIKADAPTAAKGVSAPVAQPAWMAPKVQPQDVMLFSKQLFTLIKAGVPLLRALNGLQETAINPTFKTVVGDLRRNLEAGVDLSGAMAQHPKVFDNFYVSMVRVGEASGQLEEVFKRLAEHLQFETAMRQQVKSAMRYPSFVIMAMAGAIVMYDRIRTLGNFAPRPLHEGGPTATQDIRRTASRTGEPRRLKSKAPQT